MEYSTESLRKEIKARKQGVFAWYQFLRYTTEQLTQMLEKVEA